MTSSAALLSRGPLSGMSNTQPAGVGPTQPPNRVTSTVTTAWLASGVSAIRQAAIHRPTFWHSGWPDGTRPAWASVLRTVAQRGKGLK